MNDRFLDIVDVHDEYIRDIDGQTHMCMRMSGQDYEIPLFENNEFKHFVEFIDKYKPSKIHIYRHKNKSGWMMEVPDEVEV